MKKVYIVRASEDGVMDVVFTNVRALFDFLEAECRYYEKEVLGYEDKKYSYRALVSELKNFRRVTIGTSDGSHGSIEIITATINKYSHG